MGLRITIRHSLTGIALVLLAMAAGTAGAQDADDDAVDAIEPGVDTSSLPAPEATSIADDGEEKEAEDVTRTEAGGRVMDRMELGRTEITGNQELPKVLYIVPWQKADHGELSGRPVNTLLDEVLAPVDREEFIRTMDFYEELYGNGDE